MTMDVRKGKSSAKKVRSLEWIGEIRQEFKRITWTKKEELRTYTKVVVGSIFAVGLTIYVVDLVVQGSLSSLSALIKAVIG